ncbi:hypothetical protein H9Y04_16415 [Streptomyces sp. TRM66268-LWL]|uniref:Lipoprotein n=1 Tax=Streptomyces polyasparticus TaxID=2767826 RepID=A0ABR7SI42_9ACTN|nr:hypothetical protein [Streptomyces polyasparticus]MBC9714146.1 hypothetical protein [Streptomyces polyasparticus]
MRTLRFRRSACSAAVLAGLLLTACGTEKAPVAAAPKASPRAERELGAPNGIEKLSGAEAMLRSREAMADLQSLRRVYTPVGEATGTTPAITAETDMKSGCSIRYDLGSSGRNEILVAQSVLSRDPVVYVRADDVALKELHGAAAPARFKGKYVADDQPDPMLYYEALGPCDLQSLTMESTEDAPGTTFTKGAPTEIDGMPVLPVEENEEGRKQTMYLALRGKPYVVRTTGAEYTADFSRFGEAFHIKAPGPQEIVSMAEFTEAMGIEAPHWEVDIH